MLTAKQVAIELGISARTVYDLHASGALPGYKFGRAIRFAPADVATYRESCRSAGTVETRVGVSSSTALFKAAATGLASCFRAAGVKPRLTRSTAKKEQGSMPLQPAFSGETP